MGILQINRGMEVFGMIWYIVGKMLPCDLTILLLHSYCGIRPNTRIQTNHKFLVLCTTQARAARLFFLNCEGIANSNVVILYVATICLR